MGAVAFDTAAGGAGLVSADGATMGAGTGTCIGAGAEHSLSIAAASSLVEDGPPSLRRRRRRADLLSEFCMSCCAAAGETPGGSCLEWKRKVEPKVRFWPEGESRKKKKNAKNDQLKLKTRSAVVECIIIKQIVKNRPNLLIDLLIDLIIDLIIDPTYLAKYA